mgnify:CR=1 FL=1
MISSEEQVFFCAPIINMRDCKEIWFNVGGNLNG